MTGWPPSQNANLQDLLDALREHADDGRLTDPLNSLVYYYVGRLALRANRVREALSALEHARRLAHGDPTITPRIYQALSIALDVINPPDRSTAPDSSVWSSLARPAVNRLHWSLWADLLLPQPGADRLRRAYETLNIYRAAGNLSGAGTTMRLIGDEHLARGDYRQALEWYQNSRDMLHHATRREGARDSLLLDEALTFKALGDVQYLMGRSEEALQSYELALRAHAPLPGDELSQADTHKAKGDVLHFLRQYAAALTEYEVALAAYRQGGAVISEGETLLAQGRLLEALDRQEEAWRCYDRGVGNLSTVRQFHRHGECPAGHRQQFAAARQGPVGRAAFRRSVEDLSGGEERSRRGGRAEGAGQCAREAHATGGGGAVLCGGADAIQAGRPAAQCG